MEVRDVSVEAYMKIKANGLLSKKLLQAYEIFYHNGPLTSMQANIMFCQEFGAKDNLNQFRATITHLCDKKVVRAVDETICGFTGMRVTRWDVTSGLPEKVKKLTRKERKAILLGMIEELGGKLPEEYRPELRAIWRSLHDL